MNGQTLWRSSNGWIQAAILAGCVSAFLSPVAAAKETPALSALCAKLCGGAWVVDTPEGPGVAPMHVSYVYAYDESGKMVKGVGTIERDKRILWRDEHLYLPGAGEGKLNYAGVSPNVGIVTGVVSMTPGGSTADLETLGDPNSKVRIVHSFPNPQTFRFVIYTAEDGFKKGSDPFELTRISPK